MTGSRGAEGAPAAPTFAEIDATDQEWLWRGYIPDALLTVVIAPPKASKTTLCVDLAARVSRGDVMPDGSEGGPAAPVILAALEDGSETSIAHKLRAARAELGNVVDASGGPDGDGLELTLEHVSWLRQVIAANPGARLLIIDTLSASATRPITTHTGLKAMLKPLNTLAKDTGVAVVLTAHTRKDGQPAGGQALISIPRQVLQITRSTDRPGERTLAVLASNIGADDAEGIRYSLAGDGAATRIEWAWDAVKRGHGPAPTAQNRILLLLANSADPMTPQLVASKTGIKYAVAKVLLSRMVRRGDLIRADRGTYTTPRALVASA
jgi:hypothetical protein